jgi:hypothetical protein
MVWIDCWTINHRLLSCRKKISYLGVSSNLEVTCYQVVTHLRDHGHESFALASSQPKNDASAKMPFVCFRPSAQAGAGYHDDCSSEEDDSTADGDTEGHSDEVTDAPEAISDVKVKKKRVSYMNKVGYVIKCVISS